MILYDATDRLSVDISVKYTYGALIPSQFMGKQRKEGGWQKSTNKSYKNEERESKTKQYVHGSPQRESIKWIPVMEVRGRQNSNANNLNSRDLVL